mgnify:CR=1 FL=1
MDIKNKLNSWAKEYEGSAEIHSTITLKNKDVNIVVSGDTLEEAYKKLESICLSSDKTESSKEDSNKAPLAESTEIKQLNFNEVAKPQNNNQMQQSVQNTTIGGAPMDLQAILKGRQLLRMYDTTQPLKPDEEIQRIGNIDYVVKAIK